MSELFPASLGWTTLKALVRFGLPPAEHWPNDPSRFDDEPDPMLYSCSFAEPFRSICYVHLDARNTTGAKTLQIVKSFLAAGFPSALGVSVPASMTAEPDIPYRPTFDSSRGGQALIAVGYDCRRLSPTKGALRIRNPCDPTWGESGYGWLPFVFVEDQLAADVWTIMRDDWLESGEFRRPSPEPP